MEEEEIKLLEIARDESQPDLPEELPEQRGDLTMDHDSVEREDDTESVGCDSVNSCPIFESPSFTPIQTPSESESECSMMEPTRMRKIQKTNDQLHKVSIPSNLRQMFYLVSWYYTRFTRDPLVIR